jgi:Endonuclease IV
MPKESKKPRIGAHVPTTGGMAKRSIEYAQEIGASAIQVFASSPRMWAMPAAKPELDEAYKIKAAEMDLETYVHAPFLINLGSPLRPHTSTHWLQLNILSNVLQISAH